MKKDQFESTKIDMWVNSWMHNYGIDDKAQIWDPGDIEEMLQWMAYDFKDYLLTKEKENEKTKRRKSR